MLLQPAASRRGNPQAIETGKPVGVHCMVVLMQPAAAQVVKPGGLAVPITAVIIHPGTSLMTLPPTVPAPVEAEAMEELDGSKVYRSYSTGSI